MGATVILQTDIPGLTRRSGKVRDIYDLGDSLLILVTDRLSAFDVVLPNGIPNKGAVLNGLSAFWFDKFKDVVPNHVITTDADEIILKLAAEGIENPEQYRPILVGRSMLVKKVTPLPIEAIVRGYLAGSAWKEYKKLRDANPDAKEIRLPSMTLPADMVEWQKLPDPVYTPSTKEEEGHDINISKDKAREILCQKFGKDKGNHLADQIEELSIRIYREASDYAAERGVIIADTKFEFGIDEDGNLVWIDEALTPDSSRFLKADEYEPGRDQRSLDKQYVRDYLLALDWDQTYPGPELPDEVVSKTVDRYLEAYESITGQKLAA